MVQSIILANSVAIVVGGGYLLCRLVVMVAPEFLFNIGQSWFHTVNLSSARATTSMSFGMSLLGLVSSVVIAWVATYATAELYSRLAKQA